MPGADDLTTRSVIHDVNQLLWVIQGRARLLERDAAGTAAVARTIAETAGDAAELLRSLVAEAGPEDAAAEPVSELFAELRVAWERACESVAGRGAVVANLVLEAPPEPGPLVAVPGSAVRRILQNLLVNALEAMPSGGKVICGITVTATAADLVVTDTGTGIAADLAGRLFEPGATAGKAAGSGIGLAGSRELARRHGGDIELVSPRNPGAVFQVRFPRGKRVGTTAEPSTAGTVKPLRVLAVDDEPAVREMLADLLAADGHRVETVADYETALAAFAAGRYDAALIDVNLPGRSGTELAADLRARDSRVVLILVTGWGGETRLAETPATVVDLTARKPLDLPRLQDLLIRAARLAAERRNG